MYHLLSKQIQKSPDEALEDYLDTIYLQSHSIASVKSYKSAVTGGQKGFRAFLKQKHNCDEIQLVFRAKNDELDIYQVLRDYVIFLDKAHIKPKTIRNWFAAVKGYLVFLGVEVYSEKCRQLVKMPKIERYKKEALTKEILVKLLHNLDPKLQTAVLVAVSSGMRVGEISGLKISDIDFNSHPVRINIRAETSKSREDRETFITQEAATALQDYLTRFLSWSAENKKPELQDMRIFGRTNKVRCDKIDDPRMPTAQDQKCESILLQRGLARKIVKVPGLARLARNGRRAIHFHAFREYFYTAVSNVCGSNFAHALMGHHEYLDTYYALSENQKVKMYQKVAPYLTISDYTTI